MEESRPEVSPPRSLALPRPYRIPYLVSRTQTRTRLAFDCLTTLAVSSTRLRTLLAKNHSDFAPPGNRRSDQFSGPRRVPVPPGARGHAGSPRHAQEPERIRLNISLSERLFQAWGRSGNLPGRGAWHNRYGWQPQRRLPQAWAGPRDWARARLAVYVRRAAATRAIRPGRRADFRLPCVAPGCRRGGAQENVSRRRRKGPAPGLVGGRRQGQFASGARGGRSAEVRLIDKGPFLLRLSQHKSSGRSASKVLSQAAEKVASPVARLVAGNVAPPHQSRFRHSHRDKAPNARMIPLPARIQYARRWSGPALSRRIRSNLGDSTNDRCCQAFSPRIFFVSMAPLFGYLFGAVGGR